MRITFSSWLRTSNEAKPFRDAFDLSDQMPQEFGLKSAAFFLIQQKAEVAWAETKQKLDLAPLYQQKEKIP